MTNPFAGSRTRLARAASLAATTVLMTGCGVIGDLQPDPIGGTPPPIDVAATSTEIVVDDTSGSVLDTDIPAMAENRLRLLVQTMPVGSRVVLRGVNSNVTGECQDVVFTLPPQPSQPVEQQVRQANEAAVAAKFASYVACSIKQGGATELWGGLSDTFAIYPDATTAYVYSDTCETVSIRPNTCTAKKLRDPSYPRKVVDELEDQSLVPRLAHGTTVTYVGVGRNTGLRANEVAVLRKIAIAWTRRAAGTAKFDTK